MQLSFVVIPQGRLFLNPVKSINQHTSRFQVTDANGKPFPQEIDLPTYKNKEERTVIDIWELTNALRGAQVIGVESTIVSSMANGFIFADTGGQRLTNFADSFVFASGMSAD